MYLDEVSVSTAALLGTEGGAYTALSQATKYRVGRAARLVGEEAVQMHGAIGVTDEADIGHYLKRLTAIQYSFGSGDYHQQRYIDLSSRAVCRPQTS